MLSPPLNGTEPEERRARIRRLVRMHLWMLAALLVYVFVIGRCPIYWLFGVPCPGCGMTRAMLHALRLDFSGAFYYHPLWFTVLPGILYLAHQDAWRLPGGTWTRRVIIGALAVAFLTVYLYRLFCQPNPAIGINLEQGALRRLLVWLCRGG